MRNSYLILLVAIGMVFGFGFIGIHSHNPMSYIPRNTANSSNYSAKGYAQWLNDRRVNIHTQKVELSDVLKAREQVQALIKMKDANAINLQWDELGPDNVGGRTRALLIDKDNPNVLYAGSVGGGLWKSETYGQNWVQIYKGDDADPNMFIASICQTNNGDIYFGTGEGIYYNHGTNIATPFFEGSGIWKVTNGGLSITKVASTWNTPEAKEAFVNVNELATHPNNAGTIYASTKKGLRYTTDAGITWNLVNLNDNTYQNAPSTDVKISSTGTIIASIGNLAWISTNGVDFTKISGKDEEEGGDSISSTDIGRLEFAFAPSNPSYIYCSAANTSEELRNIYLSKNGGTSWSIIGPGGSSLFQPFGTQGIYNNAIAVNPVNPNEVYVGGLNLWKGYEVGSSNSYQWTQISEQGVAPMHPLYIHADQHVILFPANNPDYLFIGGDGGVTKGGKYYGIFMFVAQNTNYNVTQFYSVGYTPDGRVLGGTQDNGTQYIDYLGNSPMTADMIIGGDGGYCWNSQLNPDIMFGSLYFSGMKRSNERGENMKGFYDRIICKYHAWNAPGGGWQMKENEGPFVTPFALWETYNDPYSTDTFGFVCQKPYHIGETPPLYSHNAYQQPVYFTLTRNYVKGDTIKYHDPYTTVMAVGTAHQLWITRKAVNFNETFIDWDWLPILPGKLQCPPNGFLYEEISNNTVKNHEDVTEVKFSHDGKHIFFATNFGKVYRSSNIHLARNKATGSAFVSSTFTYGNPNQLIVSQLIGDFQGRAITSIATDPDNSSEIIVTLGNYGESTYVYYSDRADTTTSTSMAVNFKPRQGNLPQAPVYASLIYYLGDTCFIGTEFGVYSSSSYKDENPVWESEQGSSEQGSMDPVPVFQLRQQSFRNYWRNISNEGCIYAATHGRGLWVSKTMAAPDGVNENGPENNSFKQFDIKLFPNPANEYVNVSFLVDKPGLVTIRLFDLSGKQVKSEQVETHSAGTKTHKLDVNGIPAGTYLLSVSYGAETKTSKLFKK